MLEKILKEIIQEYDKRIGIQLKIIAGVNDEINRYGYVKSLEAYQQAKLIVQDILSKHMNDDWIPVENWKPKKPYYEGDGYADGHMVYDTWICPKCGERYEVDYDNYDFCPNCGQALDWSEEE